MPGLRVTAGYAGHMSPLAVNEDSKPLHISNDEFEGDVTVRCVSKHRVLFSDRQNQRLRASARRDGAIGSRVGLLRQAPIVYLVDRRCGTRQEVDQRRRLTIRKLV